MMGLRPTGMGRGKRPPSRGVQFVKHWNLQGPKEWGEVMKRLRTGKSVPSVAASLGIEATAIYSGLKTRGLRVSDIRRGNATAGQTARARAREVMEGAR